MRAGAMPLWAAAFPNISANSAVNQAQVPLSPLSPSPDFEKYCEASGGCGEKVTTREQLPGALQRALKVVREEHRQALLNVICE